MKLKKSMEPMMTIPENSVLPVENLEQSTMIQHNLMLFAPQNVFIPEDLQNLNYVFPQYVYYPPPMDFLPSSCVYCQHLTVFNQTVSNVQNVNFSAVPSIDRYCADLPFADLPTFQYFYNLGIEYIHGFYKNAINRRLNWNARYKKGRRFKKFFKN